MQLQAIVTLQLWVNNLRKLEQNTFTKPTCTDFNTIKNGN